MDKAERARISKRERQRRWRQRNLQDRGGRIGTAVVVHLNDIEIAVLDALAIDDYRRRPCGRSEPADLTPPSRSRAVRLLIRRMLEFGIVKPEDLGPLIPLKEEMGRFWSLETAWRRASRDRRSGYNEKADHWLEQPEPPWLADTQTPDPGESADDPGNEPLGDE